VLRSLKLFLLNIVKGRAVLLCFALVFISFWILGSEQFVTFTTFRNVLSNSSITVILATALTVPFVMGDFDLSITGAIPLSGSLALGLVPIYGWSVSQSLFITAVVVVLVGVINGVAVARFGISSFVATLATSSILLGFASAITKSKSVYANIDPFILSLGQKKIYNVSITVYIALGVVLLLHLVMSRTVTGRQMLATGENLLGAKLIGIRVVRLRIIGFLISAFGGGLAGVLLFARAGQTYPNAGGPFLLPAFAAIFLGSTIMGKNRFTIVGSALAAVVLQTTSTALIINQIPSWSSDVFAGAVLFVAVLVAPRKFNW
jgi:ribose transport system permease protein